jgi:hypothetical protein
MSSSQLNAALNTLEQQFAVVSEALISGEPTAMTQASADLKELVVAFAALVQQQNGQRLSRSEFMIRMTSLKEGLNSLRTNLIRRSVPIESALNSLMPATRSETYAPQQTARYGAGARQAGAFKVLAA